MIVSAINTSSVVTAFAVRKSVLLVFIYRDFGKNPENIIPGASAKRIFDPRGVVPDNRALRGRQLSV